MAVVERYRFRFRPRGADQELFRVFEGPDFWACFKELAMAYPGATVIQMLDVTGTTVTDDDEEIEEVGGP